MDFTDVLEQLECSDSECDEISSGEEFEDLEDIVDVDIEENTSDVAEDSDSSDDNVPLADLPCSKEVAGKYKTYICATNTTSMHPRKRITQPRRKNSY